MPDDTLTIDMNAHRGGPSISTTVGDSKLEVNDTQILLTNQQGGGSQLELNAGQIVLTTRQARGGQVSVDDMGTVTVNNGNLTVLH